MKDFYGAAKRLLAIGLAAVAVTASARTVYDAGKALRQNCESGSYANPYTDANGGTWSYLAASSFVNSFSGVALEIHAAKEDGKLDGWHIDEQSYPKIMVNVSGQAMDSSYLGSAGYPIEADELILHPGDSGNAYAVLRFTVPQDGWYSAFASFHDISYQTSPNQYSGVDVHVTLGSESAGDTNLVSAIVTLEDYTAVWGNANRTHRFDYQMPVRYLTQGTRIQFVVGPNNVTSWGHVCDGTGVKVLVVREDEGRFYDSGVAFMANVTGDYVNPYGTVQHGSNFVMKKWDDTYDATFTTTVGNDFPIIRYADITLMKAEALGLGGNIPAAIPFLNRTRTRAGLDPLEAKDLPTRDAFVKELADERGREFAYEGQRWFDLVRLGLAVDLFRSLGYNISDVNLISPVPKSQLEIYNNEKIFWQNPGY